jgi:hypothetical protein
VLGFAFKADTGDTRESAAITLIRDFQSERALVNIYDPKVDPAQIWTDLAEASPQTPLDVSTYCPFVLLIKAYFLSLRQPRSRSRSARRLWKLVRTLKQLSSPLSGRSSKRLTGRWFTRT